MSPLKDLKFSTVILFTSCDSHKNSDSQFNNHHLIQSLFIGFILTICGYALSFIDRLNRLLIKTDKQLNFKITNQKVS